MVKADATGNGRREQALWLGEVREGSLEWELEEPRGCVGAGGGGRHPGGQRRLLGTRTTLEGRPGGGFGSKPPPD